MPLQVDSRVRDVHEAGAYTLLVVEAPGMAALTRPGHFVAAQVGGPDSNLLLRRAFALYDVDPAADTVSFVLSAAGPGSRWLAARRVGDVLDLVGPLGTPFVLPDTPGRAVLVGGGYGSAPLLPLASALTSRGSRVDVVLGASGAERLFGVAEAEARAATVAVTTDDGSAGRRGRVTGVLPPLLDGSTAPSQEGAPTVYACGPMAMLRAVARVCVAHGAPCQVAVEEAMACGIGVCMTCVLPAVGDDGRTRMVRSCVEGPVFPANRVRWDALGTVPADAVGAPRRGPST